MDYYSGTKEKKVFPFALVYMDLENILLSEMSQLEKERQTPYDFTHMWSLMKTLN